MEKKVTKGGRKMKGVMDHRDLQITLVRETGIAKCVECHVLTEKGYSAEHPRASITYR